MNYSPLLNTLNGFSTMLGQACSSTIIFLFMLWGVNNKDYICIALFFNIVYKSGEKYIVFLDQVVPTKRISFIPVLQAARIQNCLKTPFSIT